MTGRVENGCDEGQQVDDVRDLNVLRADPERKQAHIGQRE